MPPAAARETKADESTKADRMDVVLRLDTPFPHDAAAAAQSFTERRRVIGAHYDKVKSPVLAAARKAKGVKVVDPMPGTMDVNVVGPAPAIEALVADLKQTLGPDAASLTLYRNDAIFRAI